MSADDREAVLHIYNVEMLYAAVVDGYVDWQTAIVEAVLRASLSGDTAEHLRGHERCVSALASLATGRERLSPGPETGPASAATVASWAGSGTTWRTSGRRTTSASRSPADGGGAAPSGRVRTTRRSAPAASRSGPTRRR